MRVEWLRPVIHPMTKHTPSPTILLVDDEPLAHDLYQSHLSDEYEIRTARNGEQALEQLDETIDIVLLDRRMPGMSGQEVLETIRDRGYGCMVAMLTVVEPDFDIIEMGFDEYLLKPVSPAELNATIDSLLARATYQEEIQRFLSLTTKQATIETQNDPDTLADNEEYQALVDEVETTHKQANEQFEKIPSSDIDRLFRRLNQDQPA